MHIFFFGDSICFGQFVSPHKVWVTRIAQKLSELPGGEKICVINPSINGDITRRALERMPYDVQEHGIDVILIQFGMNDCNYWQSDKGHPRVSKQAFKANLCEIIDRAFIFGAKQVVLNTNHPTTRTTPFDFVGISYQESNESYNQIIREVSREKDVRLIDIERKWFERISLNKVSLSDLLLGDELHLSEKGHDEYFSQVYPVLEEIVRELL